jgi:hypothetical protein
MHPVSYTTCRGYIECDQNEYLNAWTGRNNCASSESSTLSLGRSGQLHDLLFSYILFLDQVELVKGKSMKLSL